MIFVDISYITPPDNFEDEAARAIADADANVNDHSDVWRSCKEALKNASGDKCYYCEIKDIRSDGTVDHYRPRSKYKWAAFSLDNFRFACTFCNSRRTDRKTGEIGGKGAGFPLLEGCDRATCSEERINEIPLLLDPCDAADPEALDFKTDGMAVPRSDADEDPEKLRAETSIEAYHLNHSDLQEARRKLAIDIRDEIAKANRSMIRYTSGDVSAKADYSNAIRFLKRCLDPRSELAAFSKRVLQVYKTDAIVETLLN